MQVRKELIRVGKAYTTWEQRAKEAETIEAKKQEERHVRDVGELDGHARAIHRSAALISRRYSGVYEVDLGRPDLTGKGVGTFLTPLLELYKGSHLRLRTYVQDNVNTLAFIVGGERGDMELAPWGIGIRVRVRKPGWLKEEVLNIDTFDVYGQLRNKKGIEVREALHKALDGDRSTVLNNAKLLVIFGMHQVTDVIKNRMAG